MQFCFRITHMSPTPISTLEQSAMDFVAAHPGAGRRAIRTAAAAEVSEATVARSRDFSDSYIPPKAALAYRDFVRKAVRYCVLELKAFRPDKVRTLAARHGVPADDVDSATDYIGRQFNGPHEGNAICYRLSPRDLGAIQQGGKTE